VISQLRGHFCQHPAVDLAHVFAEATATPSASIFEARCRDEFELTAVALAKPTVLTAAPFAIVVASDDSQAPEPSTGQINFGWRRSFAGWPHVMAVVGISLPRRPKVVIGAPAAEQLHGLTPEPLELKKIAFALPEQMFAGRDTGALQYSSDPFAKSEDCNLGHCGNATTEMA
jgi:hypothetical protein